jgi:HK97 family phage major capsid protein
VYGEVITRLETRRAELTGQVEQLLKGLEAEQRTALNAVEQEKYDALKAELDPLDNQLQEFRAQREREQRAAAARAGDPATVDAGQGGRASAVQVLSEPMVYGRGSGHSFFLDQARKDLGRGDGDGGVSEARARQERHEQELRVEMPKRLERRARQAERAWEEVASGQLQKRSRVRRREERALERFLGEGGKPFERRAISRVDGQGGYFVPPLWLVDDYIGYLRAGRVFANLWTNLPLPSGTDSINIPRVVLGTATGPQTADGGPLSGRDMTDNFVNALVRTVAGQQDAAIQLLDQSPIAFDEIIFKDLMADYAMNISGQLLVGSGTNGQLSGIYPQGTINGGSTPAFVVNNSANAWTATAGTANFYASAAQLVSQISRNRFRPPTDIITNPAVWYAMASATDTQGRPLVMPSQQGAGFNAAAGDDDGPVTEGPVGHMLGVPWSVDPNIPLTFGGTVAPSISTISQGNVAPVDGSGGNPDYTPFISGVMDDLYLWEGDLRSRTLSEVLSGTLQVRFQVYGYAASMTNRYQNSSSKVLSYGNYNTVGTTSSVLSTAGLLANY